MSDKKKVIFITGNAGSGKSTLAKSIWRSTETERNNKHVIDDFFNSGIGVINTLCVTDNIISALSIRSLRERCERSGFDFQHIHINSLKLAEND